MMIDLVNMFELPQFHDCLIKNVQIIDDFFNIYIDTQGLQIGMQTNTDQVVLRFSGFDDVEYDCQGIIYHYNPDLSIEGQEYYGSEFTNVFQEKKMTIQIKEILCKRGIVQVNGVIEANEKCEYTQSVQIWIYAREMNCDG